MPETTEQQPQQLDLADMKSKTVPQLQKLAEDFPDIVPVAPQVQAPQQRVDIRVHRTARHGPIEAEAHLVRPAQAKVGTEHALDRIGTMAGQPFHALDDRLMLFLDVPEIRELPRQLEDEVDGRLETTCATRRLNEHGAARRPAEGAKVLPARRSSLRARLGDTAHVAESGGASPPHRHHLG